MTETLTAKQQAFVEEYLVDLNGAAAARRAGYSHKGSRVQAVQLLSNPNIQSQISQARADRKERLKITADRVVEELAIIGFSDVTQYEVDDKGCVILGGGVNRCATRALSTVKHKIKDTEVRLWSKTAALEQLCKHLGLFGPKGTLEDPINVTVSHIDILRKRLDHIRSSAGAEDGNGRVPAESI